MYLECKYNLKSFCNRVDKISVYAVAEIVIWHPDYLNRISVKPAPEFCFVLGFFWNFYFPSVQYIRFHRNIANAVFFVFYEIAVTFIETCSVSFVIIHGIYLENKCVMGKQYFVSVMVFFLRKNFRIFVSSILATPVQLQ